MPDVPPRSAERPAPGLWRTIRFLVEATRAYPGPMLAVCALSLLDMALNAQIPLSLKYMIDRALVGEDGTALAWLIAGLAAGVTVVSLTGLYRDYLYSKIVGRALGDLRVRMFEHLQRLSMDFYARTEAGDVLSRFGGDLAKVENALAGAVAWGLIPLYDVVLSLFLVFWLDWRLATVAMLVWPLAFLGPRLFSGKALATSLDRQEREAGTVTAVQESVAAQGVIKVFNLQRHFLGQFRQRNEALLASSVELGFLNALIERSTSFGLLILQVTIMGAGGYMAFRGWISIGTFASFQGLFLTLSWSVGYMGQYLPRLTDGSGGMQRIQALLEETPRIADAPDAIALPPIERSLEFRAVAFGYTGKERNLEDVSLVIPRNQSVAFVGPSGSGKSTVLNLLLRFYDPAEGTVRVDGHDLRHVTQESLRDQIGVVFQESFLFDTTIRANLELGRPGATEGEIRAAARDAEIDDFVMSLPAGYDTRVGERGGRLSGGQRQRLAIARALLRKPAILVLDEATSALDPAAEDSINATLGRLAGRMTTISVTHRLASVVEADRIFVLKKGRLIEEGTHAQLLRDERLYATLWSKQSAFKLSAKGTRADLEWWWLRRIPLLEPLEDDLLAELNARFVSEPVPEGRAIVHEGDPGSKFYLIARGRVEVVRRCAGGNGEERLAVLEDGDSFGEMALLNDAPRMATVRALTETLCLSLHGDHFFAMLERSPRLREEIRRMAAERRPVSLVA